MSTLPAYFPLYGLDTTAARWAERGASIAREVLQPRAAQVDRAGAFPREGLEALAAQGLLGLCLPASVGGAGQGNRTFAGVVERLAEACGSTAMIYVMHVTATAVLASAPADSPSRGTLEQIAKGRHLTTLALSEAGSRSQFWAPVSVLEPDGEDFVLSARKSWVTAAHHADSYVSTARSPADAAAPLAFFQLDRRAPGVRVSGEFDGLGLRGNDSAPVELEGVHIPRSALLASGNEAARLLIEVVLPRFCIGTAAMANGLCLAATQATASHLQNAGFEHTQTRLRDVPALRTRVAQMGTRTEQARAMLGAALSELESGAPSGLLRAMQARLTSLEAALEVTDLAMKACGGAAFSRHLPVERLFRDARAGWVMAPTADHLQEFIGRLLTGLPLM